MPDETDVDAADLEGETESAGAGDGVVVDDPAGSDAASSSRDDAEAEGDDADVDADADGADQEGGMGDVLDLDARPTGQLPLSAFDDSVSKQDLVREVVAAERDREQVLNAFGAALAAMEKAVGEEPMLTAPGYRELDQETKIEIIQVRLSRLVSRFEDQIAAAEAAADAAVDAATTEAGADDAGDEDWRIPETDRTDVGYW